MCGHHIYNSSPSLDKLSTKLLCMPPTLLNYGLNKNQKEKEKKKKKKVTKNALTKAMIDDVV